VGVVPVTLGALGAVLSTVTAALGPAPVLLSSPFDEDPAFIETV
jgi:hypothetical protein